MLGELRPLALISAVGEPIEQRAHPVRAVPQLVVGESREDVSERVEREVQPYDDGHIPAGYRRDLVRALTARALTRAEEGAHA